MQGVGGGRAGGGGGGGGGMMGLPVTTITSIFGFVILTKLERNVYYCR